MKPVFQILITLLIASTSSLFAQNISVDELLSFRKKNLVEVEEYLTNKGWVFIEGKDAGFLSLGYGLFAYNKNDDNDLAESFIQYIYSAEEDLKRMTIRIFNTDKYNVFLGRIKSLGCKLISSKIVENSIIKVYRGTTTTFEIANYAIKDELSGTTKTYYYFGIYENMDYQMNFEK